MREPLGSDLSDVAVCRHEAIRQLEVGRQMEQIKVAMQTWRHKIQQFLSPTAEDPGLDSGGLKAGGNVFDEGQIVGSNHDQGLYSAGPFWRTLPCQDVDLLDTS